MERCNRDRCHGAAITAIAPRADRPLCRAHPAAAAALLPLAAIFRPQLQRTSITVASVSQLHTSHPAHSHCALPLLSRRRIRRPLPKAPRADNAPIEGREVRSREEGFGKSARQMDAIAAEDSRVGKAPTDPLAGAIPQPIVDGDTSENQLVDEPANATIISSTSKRLADEMKTPGEDEGESEDDPDPPTRVRGKKTDPKKSK